MKLQNKEKLEIFMSKVMKEKVRAKAKELGTSMAEVIKRALEEYLK